MGAALGADASAILHRLREMKQHQQEKYGWLFQYLGANQDAEIEAAKMGYDANKVLTFAANAAGAGAAMQAQSKSLRRARMASRESLFHYDYSAYDDADRAAQADAGIAKYNEPEKK